MKTKKRTLRELTNIITRLKKLDVAKVKIDDIEVTFIPDIVETTEQKTKDIDMSGIVSDIEKSIEDKRSKEEKEEDELFEDGF